MANFLTMIFAKLVLEYFVVEGSVPDAIVEDPYYILDIILYWLLYNLVMYYVQYVGQKYLQRVNASNSLIEK